MDGSQNNIPPPFGCSILIASSLSCRWSLSLIPPTTDPHLRSSVHLTQLRNRFRIHTNVPQLGSVAFKLALRPEITEEQWRRNSNKLILTLLLVLPIRTTTTMLLLVHFQDVATTPSLAQTNISAYQPISSTHTPSVLLLKTTQRNSISN